jgi:lysophospholipid acyltransferase (LPLAT)-like uncharacterized protein
MKLKKIKQDFLRFTGNFTLFYGINVLCKTLRISVSNKEQIDKLEVQDKNYVVAFWHGTMLLPWYLNRNKNFAALISKSKDGELLGRILSHWNYDVIRGSSSSGGDVALGIMVDYAKSKSSIAITPDGPRGPAFKMKAGAVITAKKSGLPLVLLGVGYKSSRKLKSWDSFQVPYFFTKANVKFSEPIYINNNLNYDETSQIIKSCEQKLFKLQAEAEIFN